MAVLTEKKRSALRSGTFGLPEQRKYPMPDRAHAINAKARATQQLKKRNLTPAQYRAIFAKARSVLRRG